MVAQDLLCCHYRNYTSNLMKMTHVCDNGDSLCVECIPTLHADIELIMEESIKTLWLQTYGVIGQVRENLCSISRKEVISVFLFLNFGGDPSGIY